ncbi:MAG: putative mucin/carbohydrate-binding domain-containing protein [Sarcina sp.]
MKRAVVALLVSSMVATQVPVLSFAQGLNVNKDTVEDIKIYRKTSRTPHEEKKNFNGVFHAAEPLGIEIMEETKIDILVSGKGISGKAHLQLHDVENLHGIQTINVGEKTTVKIPKGGQLFLAVADVKFESDDLATDFNFDVEVTLNKADYELTPTFDVRKNKISDKTLSEDEFLKQALSEENKEEGSLLISDNVRIYIPVSKYVTEPIDPDKILQRHERTIELYNEKAGLLETNESLEDRPRENFVLVSARNQQVGLMSAGPTMLDTHTKNIGGYLRLKGHWGQSHEYGHLYENGWGFVEYWCNAFATTLEREITGNSEYNWATGPEKDFMNGKGKEIYGSYLTEGKIGSLHPLHYWFTFIDNYDKDYMAKMSRYYKDMPYAGNDYIAYFAAMNYGINIIPFLEMAGYPLQNLDAIKDVIENSKSTYIYMPTYGALDEYKDISFPATVNPVYSGVGRSLSGMSNPNSDITVNIDGKEYKTKTDANSKFTIKLDEKVSVDSVITVISKEKEKKNSFAQKVKVIDEKARVSFRGYASKEVLSLEFDDENKKFIAKSNGELIHPNQGNNYIIIEHYNKGEELKNTYKLHGTGTADEVAAELNKTSYIEGDYLKIHHKEQYSRLVIDGDIINSPYKFNTGVKNINSKNSYFYIQNGKLVYSDKKLELDGNKEDIEELLTKTFDENKYTKTSWKRYMDARGLAQGIINNQDVTENDIAVIYAVFENAIKDLRELNRVEFKGYNNNVFLELGFNSDEKKFVAKSSGDQVHKFHGARIYSTITHFDKKGNEKAKFEIRANETGEKVASYLNNLAYDNGDYLKFDHLEKNARLVINGHVENAPYDLSKGAIDLDLNSSYFYLTGESFEYSDKQLDLSADKTELVNEIEKAKTISGEIYSKDSFAKLQEVIVGAEKLILETNVTSEEINGAISRIRDRISKLRELNQIQFKGYDNETFLTLEFDSENNKFKAVSNGKMVHPYQYSKEYVKVTHYDKKGAIKGEYSVKANETADKMADEINKATFNQGDFIKLNHIEKNSRLVINGYVENAPYDLSTGGVNLDLAKSYFYLGENLIYSDKHLDLSDDKTTLVNRIEEAKKLNAENYTKSTFEKLQGVIKISEELVGQANLNTEEINLQVKKIDDAIKSLKEVNLITFKGYGNNESLKVSFEPETKKLSAVSNGETIHKSFGGSTYIGVELYDKKGNKKAGFTARGGENANQIAEEINKLTYADGDFLKLYHREPNSRFIVNGYVENAPHDLSVGGLNINLATSYFYLDGESLRYSNEHLDLSDDKTALVEKIAEAKKLTAQSYTKTSFAQFIKVLENAEKVVVQANLTTEEINLEVSKLNDAIESLREVNHIEFKGYKNETFLDLKFDIETNKFKAISSGKIVHPYQYSKEYAKVIHFDQKGNIKGEYSAVANQTADEMANSLNKATFAKGDYIKINHLEKNGRLVINGFVENAPYDLSTGGINLDLENSYFYLGKESLEFTDSQIDLSADKTGLIQKINEAKEITSEGYTKTSFENLGSAIVVAQGLISQTNVLESELNTEIENLKNAINSLRLINIIEFKGYDNVTFLSLRFDTENNKFVATSNGKMVHPYHYSKVYSTLYHYDSEGNLKGEYSVKANETADNIANALNKVAIEQGDYIKLSHLEQNGRLAIKGYIENFEGDISNGVGSLDLNTSTFGLDGENLNYINK